MIILTVMFIDSTVRNKIKLLCYTFDVTINQFQSFTAEIRY